MKYHFNEIERKWQAYWAQHQTFKASNASDKPKFYVLDMFPYPSGAGLHVGHPLGYIASDIYARFKRHQGYNVLHPMGYDSFGLPAEQYAIQTGQHPAVTTEANIKRYREQLDQLGFAFDWSREVRTSDPGFYKWTQWIFMELFESWYDTEADKARPVSELVALFEEEGNTGVKAVCDADTPSFTPAMWNSWSVTEKEALLLKYRLTYLADIEVNWCPALGTVLANDEIVNGVSERGGHPVVRKKMRQWSMRISAYAERLLGGLEGLDWPEPLKEMQRNWIGKSVGAMVHFDVQGHDAQISVFTTRPDTIYGVSFMTLAPEHELVDRITTPEQRAEVEAYKEKAAQRSERERMADVKTISGVFTGAYALHPFTGNPIPVWIGDYVLAGYGTGAVMAVPCGDQRDFDFARHFDLPIPNIFADTDISDAAFAEKEGVRIAESDFLNGLTVKEATQKAIERLEAIGKGFGKINYRLRDAVFSRQRYWGEPFPVYYVDGLPKLVPQECLPLVLPEVEKYLPTETGEPPLGNATRWAWDTRTQQVVGNDLIDNKTVFPLELNTMPGWAGSSWYFNRYMDAGNTSEFAASKALSYWKDVDLYIGGSEHATGHLLYSRFWQKFLFDRGWVPVEEFAKKLINQGMILGSSAFVYRVTVKFQSVNYEKLNDEDLKTDNWKQNPSGYTFFISKSHYQNYLNGEHGSIDDQVKPILDKANKNQGLGDVRIFDTNVTPIHVDVALVNLSDELDIEGFRKWRPEFAEAEFVLENGKYVVGREVEKMSKSKYNVVNPDDICAEYGADTLRMYEMFLGPLEQAKPWNTAGITGVHSFLKKLWKLYHRDGSFGVSEATPPAESLKTLHKTIKKVTEDIENFSFNTSVATFMICVNELTAQQCNHRGILEPLAVLIAPYAPHIAEELWQLLGYEDSVANASYPICDETYLVEDVKNYPVSFNGKLRFTKELSLSLTVSEIEAAVMADERTVEQLQGRSPKKVIVVPGKIVNIVG